jgi:hypothetical protein
MVSLSDSSAARGNAIKPQAIHGEILSGVLRSSWRRIPLRPQKTTVMLRMEQGVDRTLTEQIHGRLDQYRSLRYLTVTC